MKPHLPRLLLALAMGALLVACPGPEKDPVCGNGQKEASEQCDDGNTVNGDGCSATCKTELPAQPVCGNGQQESGEGCDDGNRTDGDGCSAQCQVETETPVCGNGTKESGEACDDGNTADGDGCSAQCEEEPPACGNGRVEEAEQCDDGNTLDADGCEADCTQPQAVVTCPGEAPAPPESGTCTVTAGTGTSRLVTGVVLGEHTVYNNGQVLYDEAGVIQCVGCNCAQAAGAAEATRVVCPGGVVSPGLINAHDHMTYQGAPYTATEERYEHRHDWRRGNNGHTEIPASNTSSANLKAWGELRQVIAGTTSLNGSGDSKGLLRNLDRGNFLEGLTETPVEYETFPLGDSNATERTSNCGYSFIDPAELREGAAFTPHVAEGIEQSARNEFRCISGYAGEGLKLIGPRTAIIHGIGLTAVDVSVMKVEGTRLIWSPRSNITLYGDTAPVALYKKLGVPVALGTDWLPSGSMNLLRELQCADYLNQSYYGSTFSDRELWMMVTGNAADAMGMSGSLGRLAPGKVADLAVYSLRSFATSPHRAVVTARPEDVVLTVRGGKVLFGDKALTEGLSTGCEDLEVCGSAKAVCLAGEGTGTLAQLVGSTSYPLFSCEAPPNEPTCTPSRTSTDASFPASVNGSTVYTGQPSADDQDGDGVADAQDNCPAMFNPARPMDNGQQLDTDGDAAGDVCDVCPLKAGATECGALDATDVDGDGAQDSEDNCLLLSNPGQEDTDDDGKGDACDVCAAANPGDAACPLSIFELRSKKNGTYPYVGMKVSVQDVLVTGLTHSGNNGYFVQTWPLPSGKGPEDSGIYVYGPKEGLAVGDRIDITSAGLTEYFGLLELEGVTVEVKSSGNPLPTPVLVTPDDVRTGGPRARALEGVLVELSNVYVTAEPDSRKDFVVDDNPLAAPAEGLRVGELLYAYPAPFQGESFQTLRGIVTYTFSNHKVLPRSGDDMVSGPPTLKAMGPDASFARVGSPDMATVPSPLTVTLTRTAEVDTAVVLVSSDVTTLTVPATVTVPAGESSVVVPVTGLAPGEATVTATVGVVSKSATVQVLAADAQPAVASLTGPSSAVPGSTVSFTLTLDIPPATDTVVTLALDPAAFGTLPATVTVPANTLSATFELVLGGEASGTGTVTATLGTTSAQAFVQAVAMVGGLVINEVDYDQVNADTKEFVELYNAGASPVSLAGLQLAPVNGNNGAVYDPVDLSTAGVATLAPGEFLVVATNATCVASTARVIRFAKPQDNIQNGAPDALALVDTVNNVVLDKLSYEGSFNGPAAAPYNGASMQEGATSTTALADSNAEELSLVRKQLGVDTDDNGADFELVSVPTPGWHGGTAPACSTAP